MKIDKDNHELAKKKVGFLTKTFLYEDPKKAIWKGVLYFVLFISLALFFLFLEMNTVALVLGVLSVFFLITTVEKFIEWRKEK